MERREVGCKTRVEPEPAQESRVNSATSQIEERPSIATSMINKRKARDITLGRGRRGLMLPKSFPGRDLLKGNSERDFANGAFSCHSG